MSVREIIKMGNPVLREIAEDFSPKEILSEETQSLVEDMWDSMEAAGGIGLAAPQIGISKQLAVIRLQEQSDRYPDMKDSEDFVIFNPKITVLDETEQGFWEGCLSIPGMRGYVERPQNISVSFIDELGEFGTLDLHGFPATVLQHELDHLNGVLYVDRMADLRSLSFEDEWTRYSKEN